MTENPLTDAETALLRRSVELAAAAREAGNHPFGALVADEYGEIVAEAWNNALPPDGDPTQHAELRAVAAAVRAIGPEQMRRATLFTSAEPCAMCTGAAYWTGVGRIVYGLAESSLLALTGAHEQNPTLDLPCREVLRHGQREIAVLGPLLEDEAARVHDGYWV
ncbi:MULTISPECIES: nucleoside deaminase [Kocuria]|jgi:tRNA(Arg) A34 adenosine deaminase TadA|uniref:Nucleoside deaminase n=1 Tax=Kocuria oceani TaxID=988827 RepID=A0ABV9TLP2_9MICC|nr:MULTISPECIES: nucleoside deaminase [Kocuria]KLU09917.1 cytidine deaminase [Kocuria sp. SM24M-10]OLT12077.1 tRNA-specific adenosine deaminase [Kocuria sp. CNJ-770]